MWHCTHFIKLGKETLLVWDKDKNDANLIEKSTESNFSIADTYVYIFSA